MIRGGLVIKKMRKARGFTQGELATIYGSDVKTVSRWEVGHHEPSFLDVILVAETLEFTGAEMISLAEEV